MNFKKSCSRIITHNGKFHCDEAFACVLLKTLPTFANAQIIRTRDPEVIKTGDVVVDVGGKYEISDLNFDHHQKTFQLSASDVSPGLLGRFSTKLSSAGLVYCHFGVEVLKTLVPTLEKEEKNLNRIFVKIYENFVEEIDAVDNGLSQYPDIDEPPKYRVSSTLASRVSGLNPAWNQEGEINDDDQFEKAMTLVRTEFLDRVHFYAQAWLPARSLVEEALQPCLTDKSLRIMILPTPCPWKDHFFDLEEEHGIQEQVLFLVYPDTKADQWRVQCVSINKSSFKNRLSLCSSWAGLRDDELSKVSGLPGTVFVHSAGFIGGAKSKEVAIKMAEISIKQQQEEEK